MKTYKTFGGFLREIRLSRFRTMRETARDIGVKADYYSSVENDRTVAFEDTIIEKVVQFLSLDESEKKYLYTLAAESRSQEYINAKISHTFAQEDTIGPVCFTPCAQESKIVEWQQMVDDLNRRQE